MAKLLQSDAASPQSKFMAAVLSSYCKLPVFRLGLFEDGCQGRHLSQKREEILICVAGFGIVALRGVSTCQAEAGQHSPWKVSHKAAVLDELLKRRA